MLFSDFRLVFPVSTEKINTFHLFGAFLPYLGTYYLYFVRITEEIIFHLSDKSFLIFATIQKFRFDLKPDTR